MSLGGGIKYSYVYKVPTKLIDPGPSYTTYSYDAHSFPELTRITRIHHGAVGIKKLREPSEGIRNQRIGLRKTSEDRTLKSGRVRRFIGKQVSPFHS